MSTSSELDATLARGRSLWRERDLDGAVACFTRATGLAALLDAVRGYLTDHVMPGTSGQLSFHARVAANVLAIVARELELGELPHDATLADQVAARLAVSNPRYFGDG